MAIDDIVRATDDAFAARKTQRFVDQVARKAVDQPNVTTTGDDVVVDFEAARGTDFRSNAVLDPTDTTNVQRSVIRLGEVKVPNRRTDPDIAQAEENFLEREVGRVVNELGIGRTPDTRIRRDFPGPTQPDEPLRLIPHADFKQPVRQDDFIRFLDRGPERIVNSFSDFLDDLL